MKLKPILKTAGLYFKDHAPEILTGVGISGMITTCVLSVKATPKAMKAIEDKKAETTLDKVKAGYKYYILPGITGTLSTICLICSCTESKRRNAALAAALTLTEDNFIEYKDKVKEMIGDKKEQHVEEAILQDKALEQPVNMDGIIHTGLGNTLCLDSLTGQRFYSDIESIRSAFNDLNDLKSKGRWSEIVLNDYTQALHIEDSAVLGTVLSWGPEDGLLELVKTTTLIGNTPCFVIGHRNPPRYHKDYA